MAVQVLHIHQSPQSYARVAAAYERDAEQYLRKAEQTGNPSWAARWRNEATRAMRRAQQFRAVATAGIG